MSRSSSSFKSKKSGRAMRWMKRDTYTKKKRKRKIAKKSRQLNRRRSK